MSKYIFLDIDGTLVDYDTKIPDSAVTAIRQARAQGHQVFICSGRSRAEIYPELWDIGLDGFIGGNGCYIEYQNQVLYHQMFTEADCRALVDWLNQRGLGFYLECNSGLYASPNFVEEAATIYGEASPAHQDRIRAMFPDMIYGADLYRDDLNKISFRLHSEEDYQAAKVDFPWTAVGFWSGTGGGMEFGEFGQKGIDKATAIAHLIDHLGANQTATIAFGDGSNDLTMLNYCQTGVAMGNASDALKEVADLVTARVDQDGLFKGFEALGLI